MFGIGMGELALVGLIALIIYGPDKLPGLARKLGKFSAEAKKTADEVRAAIRNAGKDDSND